MSLLLNFQNFLSDREFIQITLGHRKLLLNGNNKNVRPEWVVVLLNFFYIVILKLENRSIIYQDRVRKSIIKISQTSVLSSLIAPTVECPIHPVERKTLSPHGRTAVYLGPWPALARHKRAYHPDVGDSAVSYYHFTKSVLALRSISSAASPDVCVFWVFEVFLFVRSFRARVRGHIRSAVSVV